MLECLQDVLLMHAILKQTIQTAYVKYMQEEICVYMLIVQI